MAAKTTRRTTKKPGANEAIAADLHAKLTATVTQLVTSDGWGNLLRTLTQKNGTEIGRYSFGNMLLILTQCPDATAVCSYKQWQARGRQVIKGETALRINAPRTFRQKDAETGEPATAKDGAEKTWTTFKLVPVFDVSQTEPVWQDGPVFTITPALPPTQSGPQTRGDAPAEMWEQLAEHAAHHGYTVERGDTGAAEGWTTPDPRTVRISDAVPQGHATVVLAHEVGHIECGHLGQIAEYREHRGRMETEAESFAFMVAAYFGVDSSVSSAPYIGGWAGQTPSEVEKTVTATGTAVLKAFRRFLEALEGAESTHPADGVALTA